jgi:hypothetical protein
VHVFHVIPYTGLFVGGPYTIPVASTGHHCKNGKLSSNSATISVTRFTGPHKSSMRQYTTQSLFIRTQPTRALIDSGGGYHLRSSEFQIRPLSSFPSSILLFPLIAPPGLILCQLLSLSHENHIGPPSIERALSRAVFDHSASIDSLHN